MFNRFLARFAFVLKEFICDSVCSSRELSYIFLKGVVPMILVQFFQSVPIQAIDEISLTTNGPIHTFSQSFIWKKGSFAYEREEIEFLSSCTIIQRNNVLLISTRKMKINHIYDKYFIYFQHNINFTAFKTAN